MLNEPSTDMDTEPSQVGAPRHNDVRIKRNSRPPGMPSTPLKSNRPVVRPNQMPNLQVPNTDQVKSNYEHPKMAKYESNQDAMRPPTQNQPALGARKYSYQEVT